MKTALYIFISVLIAGACFLLAEALKHLRREQPLADIPKSDEELVRAVAMALRRGVELNNGWRDYGGHGLVFKDGKFVYGASHDGHIDGPNESINAFDADSERRVFDYEDEFCEWLLFKLSEHGPSLQFHTSISRARLEHAALYGLSEARDGASVRI
jgi:hypothetical protein